MSATTIKLWLIRETDAARLYAKHEPPPQGSLTNRDQIWVPKSIVEHTSKDGAKHLVKLPDWFIRKEGL